MCYRTLFRNFAVLLAATTLTLAACKRSDNNNSTTTPALTNADDNGGYASDAAKLEQDGNDVISISDAAATTGTTNLRTTSGYPTVTRTTSGGDTIITIDFGPTPHICLDLRTREGQIIVSFSGPYKDSGTVRTITSNNYYIAGLEMMVHKTVTNEGTNSSGQVWYNVSVNDSIVLGTDSVIYWTGTRTRTWDAGYSTPDRSDDVYLIGGTTVLHRADGNVFTFNISTSDPLKVAIACKWIEAGTVTISSTSFTGGDRTLNYTYGGGGCDDMAQVTIGTHTYDITLH